jgi:hypothetical protein
VASVFSPLVKGIGFAASPKGRRAIVAAVRFARSEEARKLAREARKVGTSPQARKVGRSQIVRSARQVGAAASNPENQERLKAAARFMRSAKDS